MPFPKLRPLALLPATLVALAGCGAPGDPAPPVEPPTPPPAPRAAKLVVGDIDANAPIRKLEWFQPFADHLASRLGRFGITTGEVRIAPDIDTMIAWLRAGEVDVYLDSLYPALIVCSGSGATPVLRRWKGGVAEYHTIFLTTPATGITSLDELEGRMLALDDEASTSGFLLPIAHLRALGLEMTHFRSADARPPPDRVGYVFSGDDENTVLWLLSHRVDAAAIDDISFRRGIPPDVRERLVVLGETGAVPRQVVVARAQLDPALLAGLIELLLALHESPEGRAALESIDTERFDRFPEGPEMAMRRLETTYKAVREWLDP